MAENGTEARVVKLEDWRRVVENDVKHIPIMVEQQRTLSKDLKSLRTVLVRILWVIAVPAITATGKVIYDAASRLSP